MTGMRSFAMAPIVLSCLAMPGAAPAQSWPGQSWPAPKVAPVADVISLEDDQHRRLTVEVMVKDHVRQFMVDTAAERTVVSDETARELGLAQSGPLTLHSMSGPKTVNSAFLPALKVSAQHIGGIRAPILSQSHMAVAGILGLDSLRGQHVQLDFVREVMTITPAAQTKLRYNRNRGTVDARDIEGRLVITDASIGGLPVYVIVDTGSPVTIGNGKLRSLAKARAMRNPRFGTARITSVTGGVIETSYGMIDEIRLGGFRLTGMPSAFADLYIFRHLGLDDRPTLLLGMDTLRMFDQVSIDFANRKVRFLPRGQTRLESPMLMAALGTAGGD